jgi:hypothetical protein
MSIFFLPGIFKIEYLPSDELILYPKKRLNPGDPISAIGNFISLPLVGMASCSYTNERTNSGILYSTKVIGMFTESDGLPKSLQHRLSEKYHAFRLTDVHRNKTLIGTDEKPHPEVVFSPVIDGVTNGIRAINFEITWKSYLPPIDLVVL